jgi:uncharacterized protein YdhG (YjbR/CyaY superfamily)
MATTTKSSKRTALKATKTFSSVEREAMQEAAREAKRGKLSREDGEAEVLAKIAAMTDADRKMAERIHAIVKEVAPELEPKTWYGMPAWAKDGKNLCFFQSGAKFKTRYATFGFSDVAKLDDGNLWPNAYALTKLTPADEKAIAALVKRAVG